MVSALSNPYEITLDKITCKVSPYGIGSFVANADLAKLGDTNANIFKELLFARYHVEQTSELDGIIVGPPKPE